MRESGNFDYYSGGILCSTLGELSAGGTRDDGIVLGFAAFSPEEIRGCADQVERALSG